MRIRFSGLTRRPLMMALVVGGGMIFVAINSFDVEPMAIAQLTLTSLIVVLMLAVPAALLVLVIKIIQRIMQKNEGEE